MAKQTNKDLYRFRPLEGAGFLSAPSTADRLFSFLTRLLLITLWKSLGALSVPFGRLFAVYFWLGKSAVNISLFLEQQLLKAVGWLHGTAFSRQQQVGKLSRLYLGADLRRWHLGIAALVLGGLVHTVARKVRDQFDERLKRIREFRRRMADALSYEQWRKDAEQLEALEVEDRKARGVAVEHEAYDRKLLLEKTRHLKKVRATANPQEVMFGLRIDLIRNIANIAKSQKHKQDFVRVPPAIQQYIKEVQEQLHQICAWPELELPLEEKVSFFRVTRHTFGRTALLLSGGGGLGTFHLGVCKSLFERQLLPRVLAGSSVGSIVCAVVGTRTDYELRETFSKLDKFDIGFFQNSRAVDLVRSILDKGHMQDIAYMVKKLRQLLGDCTFLEAYERTGRILNVTVCPADTNEPPRLLNYLTAPQALIWSAVAASSSFPGLYPPQHIVGRNSKGEVVKLHAHGASETLQRRWRDGSLEFDLPVQALAEMFNVNHFLVSQTNPHIVPLVNFKSMFPHKWGNIMEAELKHRLQVVQWMLPTWQLSKWLMLFTQPWEGDITFTLPSALWNISKTVINPTTEDLLHAVKVGEVATWQRMAAIECNCTIEATLDKCVARVQNMARGRSTTIHNMGGKVPSWLHMPAVGMPMVQSWGDNLGADVGVSQAASWGDLAGEGGSAHGLHGHGATSPSGYRTSGNGRLGMGVAGAGRSRATGLSTVAQAQDHEEGEGEEDGAWYSSNQHHVLQAVGAGMGGAVGLLGRAGTAGAAHHVRVSMDGRAAAVRLPPIPSSQSSRDSLAHEDGFDSASSVMMASGGGMRGQHNGGGAGLSALGATVGSGGAVGGIGSGGPGSSGLRSSSSSAPMSRRGSMASGLSALAGPDADGACRPAMAALGSYHGLGGALGHSSSLRASGSGMAAAALSDPAVGARAGAASSGGSHASSRAPSQRGSPAHAGPGSARSSVSLTDGPYPAAPSFAAYARAAAASAAAAVAASAQAGTAAAGGLSSAVQRTVSAPLAPLVFGPPRPPGMAAPGTSTHLHTAGGLMRSHSAGSSSLGADSACEPDWMLSATDHAEHAAATTPSHAHGDDAASQASTYASQPAHHSGVSAEDIIKLACMDVGTDADPTDTGGIWGALLPLAGTCQTLEAHAAGSAAEGGASGTAGGAAGGIPAGTSKQSTSKLDVFAY